MSGAVLLISPEPWEAHWVSKHHYARVLGAAGRRVLFLDPPVPEVRGIELSETGVENVTRVRMPVLRRGLRFYPGLLRRRLEAGWLDRLERRAECAVGVVWLFENSRFFDMRFAGDRLKIYHQVDLNQRFNQHRAAATADLCFCTTDLIAADLRGVAERVVKIHHGTAILNARAGGPREGGQPNAPVVTYVGNLDMRYLDLAALDRMIREFPEVHFTLVGGFSDDNPLRKAHAGSPNVRWLGRVAPAEIPAILDGSDALLVAYRPEHHRDQASPHKVMEYLLSGRVVIASYMDEYKDKPGLVEMAPKGGDLVPVFREVLSDLARHNAPERQAARRAFALDHSYERQLDRIRDLVRVHAGAEL